MFRAAVYEHAPLSPKRTIVVTRQEALDYMRKNLEVYRTATEDAQRQNVDILVFPEDGLTYYGHTRKSAEPYLEYIPDPKQEQWNPCEVPDRYSNTEVQYTLSCLAKNNSLWIVANMGDYQPCQADDTPCPADGHYQFNTDVVYDSNGTLIAKYHKINLYYEFMFDPSASKEAVSFETPFGTFGVFTCFDILFRNPVVVLLKDKGVSNIVFPTAWMDVPPFLAAIQFHSAVAVGFGINFLAANLHNPPYRFQGSGIYSPNGAVAYYYNNTDTGQGNGGKLLVSDLKILRKNALASYSSVNRNITLSTFTGKQATDDGVFQAVTHKDQFNYVLLTKASGEVGVCHRELCCSASYKFRNNFTEMFALGAYDGLHKNKYYIQVCTIIRCKTMEKSSCGKGSLVSKTYFNQLALSGTFKSPYVFPEILLYGENILNLAPPHSWSYTTGRLETKHGWEQPVLSFSLYSRHYDHDLLIGSHSLRVTFSTICLPLSFLSVLFMVM